MATRGAWTLDVVDNAIVAEFPGGTGVTPSGAEEIRDRWAALAERTAVDTVVLVVRTTRPCSDSGRDALRMSARAGGAEGVTRWAIVAERSKRRYLRRTVDVAGVDVVEGFNDRSAALEWARS